MSRYLLLQKLLKQDDSAIDLSFYPDHLLNLRSILAEWVEEQDWAGALCESGDTVTCKSGALLKEALGLLLDKLNNANNTTTGFEFHIRNTETLVKKTYEDQPVKFVQDLHSCLNQEDSMVSTMMSQDQAMCVDNFSTYHISASDLAHRIKNCLVLDERIQSVLHAGALMLRRWKAEVISKSPTPRDVFGNEEIISAPYLVFQKLKQELDLKTDVLIKEVGITLSGLEWHIKQWKAQQLHQCVARTVESDRLDNTPSLEIMCEHMCTCVNNLLKCAYSSNMREVDAVQGQHQPSSPSIPTPSIVSRLSLELKDILKRVVETLLVVLEQPPLTMMIEKEKGQKDKEDINNSKKFKTTIGILGGKGFGESLVISEVELYLAFSRDLAKAQEKNRKPDPCFRILLDRCDTRQGHSSRNLDSPTLTYEKTYKQLRVEHFSRKEIKHVYKQLYHVVYDITICFPIVLQEFNTQIVSLPIIVRTGANQASEHIGAQLWHSFTSLNVYDLKGEMAVSMKVSSVIQMLDERILSIGGRGLRDHEKSFLTERLIMAANGKSETRGGESTVTLDNFIKDKVCLPKLGTDGACKDSMDFSLWRWLHSIINLVEEKQPLHKAWVDGIIYGFASRKQCITMLQSCEEGTFLLRFSESYLPGNHIMAKGGIAAVVVKEGQVMFAPPISSDEIEKAGLAEMIKNIGCKVLLGTNLTIDDLMNIYPPVTPQETPIMIRYDGWCKREFIVPSDKSHNETIGLAQPVVAQPSVSVQKRVRKKAKRPSQQVSVKDNSSSKQYRSTQPESPESTTGCCLSSPQGASPEWHSQLQFQPSPSSVVLGDSVTTQIPTTVLSELSLTEQLPPMRVKVTFQGNATMPMELSQDSQDIMDISKSTRFPSSNIASSCSISFVENVAVVPNMMVGPHDPSMHDSLLPGGLSLEELEEYLEIPTSTT